MGRWGGGGGLAGQRASRQNLDGDAEEAIGRMQHGPGLPMRIQVRSAQSKRAFDAWRLEAEEPAGRRT